MIIDCIRFPLSFIFAVCSQRVVHREKERKNQCNEWIESRIWFFCLLFDVKFESNATLFILLTVCFDDYHTVR